MQHWKNKKTVSGFTLLEILIVLMLFALTAYISFNQFTCINTVAVRNELDALALTCRFLQQRAMITAQPQELIFDQRQRSYHYLDQQHQLPPNISFGLVPGVHGPPSLPSHPLTSAITFDHSRIIFHPDGIISPGMVCLTNTQQQCIYALSCGVSHVSYLRKYRYTGSWTRI